VHRLAQAGLAWQFKIARKVMAKAARPWRGDGLCRV